MSKTTIENAENVSPIFEGTLGRDAMAEALKLVRKETGLSQRDAAKAVGTTNADIGRIETGKATLDKSAEVLAELGYKMNIQLVPIGKS